MVSKTESKADPNGKKRPQTQERRTVFLVVDPKISIVITLLPTHFPFAFDSHHRILDPTNTRKSTHMIFPHLILNQPTLQPISPLSAPIRLAILVEHRVRLIPRLTALRDLRTVHQRRQNRLVLPVILPRASDRSDAPPRVRALHQREDHIVHHRLVVVIYPHIAAGAHSFPQHDLPNHLIGAQNRCDFPCSHCCRFPPE